MKCTATLVLALVTAFLMIGCTTQEDTAPELLSSTLENRPALLLEAD